MATVEKRSVDEIFSLMYAPSHEEKDLISRAFSFAEEAHRDHQRFSGEPYFNHLVETAKTIATLGLGPRSIVAALLHDTIEDTGVEPSTIEREFGKEVLFLIEGVTKLGKLKYHGVERHRESMRKLLVATSKDVRVLIIKLADRLHNMRTLEHVREDKRKRIALETLEIYAAIAHRLGMGVVRRELEDLAFRHAYPEEYEATRKVLSERTKETMTRLDKMERTLKKALGSSGIVDLRTDYRVKGLYSLYRKLQRKGGDVENIYDIAALRVIVPTIADCYRALGTVHQLWRPLPNKIKDYIAFPKPNGYRSIHTTVFAGDGGLVEVQIRTKKMHEEAEFGIASHVLYKEETPREDAGRKHSSFDWIKSLIPGFARARSAQSSTAQSKSLNPYTITKVPEWVSGLGEGQSVGEDEDFETALRTDIFSERVFAFTPKGDVIDLPAGASPIDFAYAIHSDIGDHAWGVKVNGKFVPLDTPLHNGDIVEIETRKTAKPSTKWLAFARTTLAKRHIRNALEKLKASS